LHEHEEIMTSNTNRLDGAKTMGEQWKFNEWVTELADPFWLKDARKDGEFFDANGFARALLSTSKPAAPLVTTVWKDGTWKQWSERDAICARDDEDWLLEIPAATSADTQDERGSFEAWFRVERKRAESCMWRVNESDAREIWQAARASPQATAWRMMVGDWKEELVALHGPHGHIASGLTTEQAKAIIAAHGGIEARAATTSEVALPAVVQAAAVPQIKPRLLTQLRRFNECCEDSEAGGHGVDKEDMRSLAELGAVRPAPGGRHYMTDFGHYPLAAPSAVVLDDERAALRDMLEDARAETTMIREALGVPYEPHQTLLERTLGEARAASTSANVVQGAEAWVYEFATAIDDGGRYCNWRKTLEFEPPNIPEGAVRNLRPLIYAAAQPAQTERALTDDAVRRTFALAGANRWHVADPVLAREVVKAALLAAAQPASGGTK
jgi:hypothetical protein